MTSVLLLWIHEYGFDLGSGWRCITLAVMSDDLCVPVKNTLG